MGQCPNPPRVLKKNLIPIPNSFIKFKPRPIRGEAGRVPEKTCPVAIPNINQTSYLDYLLNVYDKIKIY